MADSIDMDFSEMDRLAASISDAPRDIRGPLRTAMQVTAGKIRTSWMGKLEGSEHLPHLPRSITFDVTSDHSPTADLTAEIGPEPGKSSQAPLAHLSEFGSVNNPGRGYGLAALEENADDFERGIEKAIDDVMGQFGL